MSSFEGAGPGRGRSKAPSSSTQELRAPERRRRRSAWSEEGDVVGVGSELKVSVGSTSVRQQDPKDVSRGFVGSVRNFCPTQEKDRF